MPQSRLIRGTVAVGIVGEEFREDDLVGKGAADRKRVAHDGPLRLAEQAEDLAQIVDQPVRMNHRGWPSRRIASAVCIRCSICPRSVSVSAG